MDHGLGTGSIEHFLETALIQQVTDVQLCGIVTGEFRDTTQGLR